MLEHIETKLIKRRDSSLFRKRTLITSKTKLNFTSNDYLNLSQHEKVIAACHQGATESVGSGSAYLISGYLKSHQQLEEEIAEFLNFPRALILSCGYMANLSVLTSLLTKEHMVFADRLSHASIIDGCLATGAKLIRYPHCNIEKLHRLISRNLTHKKFYISEGIFSMDGTIVPSKFFSLSEQSDSLIYVDDSHAIGVLGKNGEGSLNHFNLSYKKNRIIMASFGKAFGTYGAFVAGSDAIIESFIQFARNYIYTTALPNCIVEATRASLKILREENWRREKLLYLIHYFKKIAEQFNIPTISETAIQPIIVGDAKRTIQISEQLAKSGILTKAILPPTVPANRCRLRISLSVIHEKRDIDYFFDSLAYVLKCA